MVLWSFVRYGFREKFLLVFRKENCVFYKDYEWKGQGYFNSSQGSRKMMQLEEERGFVFLFVGLFQILVLKAVGSLFLSFFFGSYSSIEVIEEEDIGGFRRGWQNQVEF